ncbi:hypothetical protein COO59_13855 [Mixta theicola]|uniref:Uncharacterized protein n=1 Tax=Mixta theicola TaxID=1458355 RepID=A0A2K1Q7J3_9GAMM|nr:hypothetical protein [Mixta theicola]PNS11013.1 hypothetical protein COO59_13855 [Mixta theicola]
MASFLAKKIEFKAENAMFKGVEALQPENKFIVAVKKVKKEETSIFSLKRSPSLISGYPNPVLVEGIILSGSETTLINQPVMLRLPEQEWQRIKAEEGSIIGTGIIVTEQGYGLLCLENLTGEDNDKHAAWLNSLSCRKRWEAT